jgi:hypothetical protein
MESSASVPAPAQADADSPRGGLERRQLAANTAIYIAGEVLWGFGYALLSPGTVIMTLLSNLGGRELTAGILGGVETLQGLLQPVGPSLFRSRTHLKRHLMQWGLLVMLPLMGVVSLVLALGYHSGHPRLVLAAVLAALALFNCAIGIYAGVWIEWWAQLFSQRVRGTVGGLMICAVGVGTCLGLRVAGELIAADRIATLAILAFAAATAGNLAYCFMRDVSHQGAEERMPQGRQLWALIRASCADHGVRTVLATRLCGNAVLVMGPFITLQYLQARVPEHTVIACAIGLPIGSALCAVLSGRLGDRYGYRLDVRLGLGLAVLAMLSVATVSGALGCALSFALIGMFQGCWGSAYFIVFETSPHHSRMAHVIGFNLVQAIATMIMPLAWSLIAKRWGMLDLDAVAMLLALLGLALACTRLREPRQRQRAPLPQAA